MDRMRRLDKLSQKDQRFTIIDDQQELRDAMMRDIGDMGQAVDSREKIEDVMIVDDTTNGEKSVSLTDTQSIDSRNQDLRTPGQSSKQHRSKKGDSSLERALNATDPDRTDSKLQMNSQSVDQTKSFDLYENTKQKELEAL